MADRKRVRSVGKSMLAVWLECQALVRRTNEEIPVWKVYKVSKEE